METNLNPWFHHQLSHQQSSYFNSLNYQFNLGTYDIPPTFSPCANISSPSGTLTEIAISGIPYPKQFRPDEPLSWFYGQPHCHQSLNDVANTFPHEKAPNFSHPNYEETNADNPGTGPAQKRFLVFDQSGDQTTMFFSPGIAPKLNCNKMVQADTYQHQEQPVLTYDYNENPKVDEESEMREDTEELNALLYSDDDYDYEDEEEESTGHSPSTMTNFDNHEWAEIYKEEEVASNFGVNKRIKLSNGNFEMSPLVDTASSAKLKNYSSCEDDDAESSCGGDKKRSRKDQIRETLSLLQSIIPGEKGKGKDAILIFDEAIDYLKSLKVKAQALGVDTI